jgi:hypothetical protein
MSTEGLSIFCSLLWFLFSMIYSFLSHPLFVPRYFIFWGYCKWNYFPIFFLSLFIVGV